MSQTNVGPQTFQADVDPGGHGLGAGQGLASVAAIEPAKERVDLQHPSPDQRPVLRARGLFHRLVLVKPPDCVSVGGNHRTACEEREQQEGGVKLGIRGKLFLTPWQPSAHAYPNRLSLQDCFLPFI